MSAPALFSLKLRIIKLLYIDNNTIAYLSSPTNQYVCKEPVVESGYSWLFAIMVEPGIKYSDSSVNTFSFSCRGINISRVFLL